MVPCVMRARATNAPDVLGIELDLLTNSGPPKIISPQLVTPIPLILPCQLPFSRYPQASTAPLPDGAAPCIARIAPTIIVLVQLIIRAKCKVKIAGILICWAALQTLSVTLRSFGENGFAMPMEGHSP